MTVAQYVPLRLHPYQWRSEHINVGIVVFREDGVRVHLADNLKKVRAFAPAVDIDVVRCWPAELTKTLEGITDVEAARVKIAQWGTMMQLGDQLCRFLWSTEREYADRVSGALARLVEPERKTKTPVESLHKSRLDVELKHSFATFGWLGTSQTDIDHRIVPRYLLNEETGLRADFAIKNGRMNIIETLDFRVADPASKRESAQAKSLVLAMQPEAQRYAIVAGGDGKDTAPSMRLLEEHSGGNLIRWEDASAINNFLEAMGRATGKPMLQLPTS
jgi:hypothetical protein